MGNPQTLHNNAGHVQVKRLFYGKQLFFPEFCKTRMIPNANVRMFDIPHSRYDIIVGRDILGHGFILDHARNVITWDGLSISMHETSTSTSTSTTVTTNFICPHTALTVYAASSQLKLQAKYEHSLPKDVVQTCTHLSESQQSDLLHLLTKFSKLFSGKLGRYVHKKISIHLKNPNTSPLFCTPYPVPMVHQKVFQQELDHLIQEKV